MTPDIINYFLILAVLLIVFWLFTMWRSSRRMNNSLQQVAHQHTLIRHDAAARQLCRAIHLINPHVSPGVDYLIGPDKSGGNYVIASWMSSAPRPDDEQIGKALKEMSREHHEEEYAAMRRAEYPSVGEQLEAAYEARQGNPLPQQLIDEKIARVREKYPKTEICP